MKSLSLPLILLICLCSSAQADAAQQRFTHVAPVLPHEEQPHAEMGDSLAPRSAEQIIASLPEMAFPGDRPILYFGPGIFHGYRNLSFTNPDSVRFDAMPGKFRIETRSKGIIPPLEIPCWLEEARVRLGVNRELQQISMVYGHNVDFIYANLPAPPKLLPAPPTFSPGMNTSLLTPSAYRPATPGLDITERHWLHVLNLGLQFSQAYISPNWYQGGTNNLTILANFLWNVKINQIYHPNLLVESNLQYKLGLFSTPDNSYHKYVISEDQLQWNAKLGFKAFRKWFYSMTIQFKTPVFRNYEQNGPLRTASLLSPGDFNIGLGMTYSVANKAKTLNLGISLAPISYNLKSCIDTEVDAAQFNIPAGKKTASEVGSNADITFEWKIASNILYRSRLFLFTNYKYFIGDWENTVSFEINRFLSTQIYVHGRYDTSSAMLSKKWKHWMLKEIFSFGFSYAFSTVPKK